MDININIKQPLLNEINNQNVKKRITEIDLDHLPFSKFKISIQQVVDYNRALEVVKQEQQNKFGKINIFDCMTQASKLVSKFENEKQVINFNITDETIFISSIDYEIKIPNTKVLKMVNNSTPSDIKILSDVLIDEVNSLPNEFEKSKFANNICIEALSILLCIITIFNDKKNNYVYDEKEHKEVIRKSKSKSKKRSNVTYINHKTITIHKSENTETNKSYERHTESWIQRGHWRTYKSGKKVWIKECVKNAKGSNVKEVSKTYEII